MLSFFTSFGASSLFEKSRLQLTTRDTERPDQDDLRNILNTFRGVDTETKAQVAYATIIKKMHTSDSRASWLYLLKNLVILDRAAGENIFSEELSVQSIETVEQYKETDKKALYLDTQRILKGYWRIIKQRCKYVATRHHMFCFRRGQRSQLLERMKPEEILKQIETLEVVFEMAFDLVSYLSGKKLKEGTDPEWTTKLEQKGREFYQSELVQYLYLQVLYKLMLYYSCQLQCNSAFLHCVTQSQCSVSEKTIRLYMKQCTQFEQNSKDYVNFIEERKHIKGFEEVNYQQLNPFQNKDVKKLLNGILTQCNSSKSSQELQSIEIPNHLLYVERTHLTENRDNLVPRLKIKEQRQKKLDSSNKSASSPFDDWISSYSQSFPQKQVMTVDLIEHLNTAQSCEEEDDQAITDLSRFSCYVSGDSRKTQNMDLISRISSSSDQNSAFHNMYSKLPKRWNAT